MTEIHIFNGVSFHDSVIISFSIGGETDWRFVSGKLPQGAICRTIRAIDVPSCSDWESDPSHECVVGQCFLGEDLSTMRVVDNQLLNLSTGDKILVAFDSTHSPVENGEICWFDASEPLPGGSVILGVKLADGQLYSTGWNDPSSTVEQELLDSLSRK